jgi:hypothetical protein
MFLKNRPLIHTDIEMSENDAINATFLHLSFFIIVENVIVPTMKLYVTYQFENRDE